MCWRRPRHGHNSRTPLLIAMMPPAKTEHGPLDRIRRPLHAVSGGDGTCAARLRGRYARSSDPRPLRTIGRWLSRPRCRLLGPATSVRQLGSTLTMPPTLGRVRCPGFALRDVVEAVGPEDLPEPIRIMRPDRQPARPVPIDRVAGLRVDDHPVSRWPCSDAATDRKVRRVMWPYWSRPQSAGTPMVRAASRGAGGFGRQKASVDAVAGEFLERARQ